MCVGWPKGVRFAAHGACVGNLAAKEERVSAPAARREAPKSGMRSASDSRVGGRYEAGMVAVRALRDVRGGGFVAPACAWEGREA